MLVLKALMSRLRRLFRSSGGIRYTIGGVQYVQRPLVLLQIEQLSEFLSTIELPPGLNVAGMVRMLGGRISGALAIVLTPAGTELDQKDRAAIAAQLRNHVDIETTIRVVEDFLSCNPVGSVFDKLSAAIGKCGSLLTGPGSPNSSASSPPAT